MVVRLASEQDTPGFIVLAGQVEHWSGPMVDDLGFRAVTGQHIRRATALAAVTPGEPDLLGGRGVQAAVPHRCSEAILAPSAWDRNFAQVTVGTTTSIPAMVPNPQSVPAITLSRPTTPA